jgi:drug/metabolite transporter (DMT)-like permease
MAAFYCGFGNLFPKTEGIGFTLGLGVCTGTLYLVGLLLVQLNIKKNGVVLSSIFQKLGLIVQVLISIVFFKEHPQLIQILGIIICLIAVFMIKQKMIIK